jgi:phosphoacetylglucosamine mutase
VKCTRTGVKYLHAAAKKFRIGIYFEANGHGTILFNCAFLETLQVILQKDNLSSTQEQRHAAEQLLALSELINPYIGDALTDLLAVQVILHHLGWTISDWDALYEALPNRMIKLQVRRRADFVNDEEERRLLAPLALQSAIDSLVNPNSMERVTVRYLNHSFI